MKRFTFLLIILALSTFLFASNSGASNTSLTYNVLVYPKNQELLSFLETFFVSKSYDEDVVFEKEKREVESTLKSLGESLNKAYESENATSIEDASKKYWDAVTSYQERYSEPPNLINALENVDNSGNTNNTDNTEEPDFNVKYVSLDSKNLENVLGKDYSSFNIEDAVVDENLLFMQLLCSVSNADMLIIPITTNFEGLFYLKIYVYLRDKNSIYLCHESLSQTNDISPNAYISLSQYFFDKSVCYVTFENLQQGTSVTINENSISLINNSAIVATGTHIVNISKDGYQSKEYEIVFSENTSYSIDCSLEKIQYESMLVNSNPSASVYLDGKLLGITPLQLNDYSLPLMLRFNADGYAQKNISLSKERESLLVELKPLWMENSLLYTKAKKDFYNSFAASLIIFGLKIVSNSLSSGENSTFFQISNVVLDGALVFSLTQLASNLIKYYRCSEYISP